MEKTEKTDKTLRNTNLSIDKATHYYPHIPTPTDRRTL